MCARRKSWSGGGFEFFSRGSEAGSPLHLKLSRFLPVLFIFYPGTTVIWPLLACPQTASLMYMWTRETKGVSQMVRGGLCVHCSHQIQWTTASSGSPSLFLVFILPQFVNLHPAHILALFLHLLSFKPFLSQPFHSGLYQSSVGMRAW